MVENSVREKKHQYLSIILLVVTHLSILIPFQSRRPIITTQVMAVYTTTHANAAQALPGIEKLLLSPAAQCFVLVKW